MCVWVPYVLLYCTPMCVHIDPLLLHLCLYTTITRCCVGNHVYTLALQYAGCCVVPVGKGMPMDQLVVLLQRLRPTTILATPTWLLSFSQYLDALSAPTHPHPCVHSVRAVITGGEVLFSAARNKIALSLGIDCCRYCT